MKIVTVVGARPQFIKAAVVSSAIRKYNESLPSPTSNLTEVIVHTGQHFHTNMSEVFFKELEIPKPDYNLGVNSVTHGAMTGRALERIEEVLLKEKPDWVLVYGDTNSTLAGALAAAKLHIPLAHVEAGLRSFNMRMPEEINRILTDRVSNLLLCPTETAAENLQKEGLNNVANNGKLIDESKNFKFFPHSPSLIANVGDVMYDSTLINLKRAEETSTILNDLGLMNGNKIKPFNLATVHRAENTDDTERLKEIFEALKQLSKQVVIVLPLHPRTRRSIESLNPSLLTPSPTLRIIDPISYMDNTLLEKYTQVILTDSGGMQKEAYFLKTPCITLRDETEWVELVNIGVNIVAGADKDSILRASEVVKDKELDFSQNFFGNGTAGQRIVDLILNLSM